MNYFKRLVLKIGYDYLKDQEDLHIKQLFNGYEFQNKYYKTIDQLFPEVKKGIKRYFEQN